MSVKRCSWLLHFWLVALGCGLREDHLQKFGSRSSGTKLVEFLGTLMMRCGLAQLMFGIWEGCSVTLYQESSFVPNLAIQTRLGEHRPAPSRGCRFADLRMQAFVIFLTTCRTTTLKGTTPSPASLHRSVVQTVSDEAGRRGRAIVVSASGGV